MAMFDKRFFIQIIINAVISIAGVILIKITNIFPMDEIYLLLLLILSTCTLILPIPSKKRILANTILDLTLFVNTFLIFNYVYWGFITKNLHGNLFIAMALGFYLVLWIFLGSIFLNTFKSFIGATHPLFSGVIVIINLLFIYLELEIIGTQIILYYQYYILSLLFYFIFLMVHHYWENKKNLFRYIHGITITTILMVIAQLLQPLVLPDKEVIQENKQELTLLSPYIDRILAYRDHLQLLLTHKNSHLAKTSKAIDQAIKKQSKKKHILMITIDAVTPNHLSLYGYHRNTSPNLTKFSRDSIWMKRAYSQGPNTRPALASLLTSHYTTEVYWSNNRTFIPLKRKNLLLAEILKKEGYETYGIMTHSYFYPRYGYSQGFKHWDIDLVSTNDKVAFEQETSIPIFNKLKKIFDTIPNEITPQKPLFIWAHMFDPHDTYMFRKDAPNYGKKSADIYDNELAHSDIYFGKIIQYLKDKKLYDQFIIIVAADHGEAFGTHGYYRHGRSLFNDQIWVPMMIRFPDHPPEIVEREIGHVDLVPTLLDYLDVKKYKNRFSGKSILQKIKQNNFPPIYSQLIKKRKHIYAIIYKGYKMIYYKEQNLKLVFDLRTDFNEKYDLAQKRPEITYSLWKKLSAWIKVQERIYKRINGN